MSGKFFGLLAALVLLYGFALGRAHLSNPDEGRYAEIPREMLARGDWVTPRLDGIAYFEKPPLMYWIEAGAQRIFGRSERAVRLPVAGCALLGVILTYATVRRRFGEEAGWASAAVLGTAAFYSAFSHILSLDLAVAVLISATLFAFFAAVQEPAGGRRRQLFYAMYLSAALATLTKGLIGVLLTGAVMLLWLVICGQWRRLRPLYLPTGLLLFLAVALPWHLLAARRNPTWAHFYFIHEQWERFTTTAHSRKGPPYYFVPEIFPGLFPWFGFLFAATAAALRGGWRRRREPECADRWYFFLWAAFVFLFFSKSQSKLPGYILPVLPALAVLIGLWLVEQWRAEAPQAVRATRAGSFWFGGFALLLAVAVAVVATAPGRFRIPEWQAAGFRLEAWLLAIVLVTAAGAVFFLRTRQRVRPALVTMGVAGFLMLGIVEAATPVLFKPGTQELARQVTHLAVSGDQVVHYHEFFHDFPYYADRTVGLVGFTGELEPDNELSPARQATFLGEADFRRRWDGSGRIFAVARKSDVATLFADPSFHYRLLGESRSHCLFSNRP